VHLSGAGVRDICLAPIEPKTKDRPLSELCPLRYRVMCSGDAGSIPVPVSETRSITNLPGTAQV